MRLAASLGSPAPVMRTTRRRGHRARALHAASSSVALGESPPAPAAAAAAAPRPGAAGAANRSALSLSSSSSSMPHSPTASIRPSALSWHRPAPDSLRVARYGSPRTVAITSAAAPSVMLFPLRTNVVMRRPRSATAMSWMPRLAMAHPDSTSERSCSIPPSAAARVFASRLLMRRPARLSCCSDDKPPRQSMSLVVGLLSSGSFPPIRSARSLGSSRRAGPNASMAATSYLAPWSSSTSTHRQSAKASARRRMPSEVAP
mmetsp:Transcript_16559/g.62639  ORF Transcript_16559/g.62639 Transcript_16559/m.62639 type:complete len:260 (+) Transcript_16559:228-1007(+)